MKSPRILLRDPYRSSNGLSAESRYCPYLIVEGHGNCATWRTPILKSRFQLRKRHRAAVVSQHFEMLSEIVRGHGQQLGIRPQFGDAVVEKDEAGFHHAVRPPSTIRFAPVMYDEASDTRKSTAPLYSSTFAMRPSGIRDVTFSTNRGS